jgi:hypothetical protein
VCHYQRRWNADAYANGYCDCYRYSHCNGYGNSHCNCHCYGNSNSYCNVNTDGDRCAQDNADAKAASDITASPVVKRYRRT